MVRMDLKMSIIRLYALLAGLATGDSRKVLFLPLMIRSRFIQIAAIAESLSNYGYQVYTVVDKTYTPPPQLLRSNVTILHYDTGKPIQGNSPHIHDLLIETFQETNFIKKGMKAAQYFQVLVDDCHNFLATKKIMAELEKEQFDFAVVDGVSISRCFYLVAHKLGIPYASLTSIHAFDMVSSGSQANLLVPTMGNPESLLRGQTLGMKLASVFYLIYLSRKVESDFVRYSVEKPFDSLFGLASRSKLWLYDTCRELDVAIPVPPNVIHVGGLSTREAKPITDIKLMTFLDRAQDGFIFISFGSMLEHFPLFLRTVLIETIKSLQIKVLIKSARHSDGLDNVSENVFASTWLPQNDILAHPNIRLFVTHCGNSGMHEALFHGVPMVGVPLWADQQFNARRLVRFGFGRFVESGGLTAKSLISEIQTVLRNSTYKDNIMTASKMFRDQPMKPRETAAYWIDHVIRHGGDHLRSPIVDMPWYQILMYDVICVVLFFIATLLGVCCCVVRITCRRCCRLETKKKKA